jgi:putative ribosome biogenesis GTPase RsgA
MTDKFQNLFNETQQWAENAAAAGWINSQDVQALKETQEVQIEKLFKEHGHRPLIVAFFGGTGVGKSTLLNRLAGEDIARVGVTRPSYFISTRGV